LVVLFIARLVFKRIIARIKVANNIPLGQSPEPKKQKSSLKGPFLQDRIYHTKVYKVVKQKICLFQDIYLFEKSIFYEFQVAKIINLLNNQPNNLTRLM
jgi:hypothetical protein